MDSWEAFIDELEKIGVELNQSEKRHQALQFAGMGAVAAPAIRAVQHKIEHGSFLPATNAKRWLGASVVGGALSMGALPIVRHHIERKNLESARARARTERA
jgi:hypothetical protein